MPNFVCCLLRLAPQCSTFSSNVSVSNTVNVAVLCQFSFNVLVSNTVSVAVLCWVSFSVAVPYGATFLKVEIFANNNF